MPMSLAAALLLLLPFTSRGELLVTFIGVDGTCAGAAPSTAARFHATSLSLDGAPAWGASPSAPLAFERGDMCTWCQRPAVDTQRGRAWHVAGLCANATRIAVEWALGSVPGASPTYVGACSFVAPYSSPGWGTEALPVLAFHARVFAAGPIVVNATGGAPAGGPTVVGLTVPPDPGRRVQSIASLPPCSAAVLAQLPADIRVATGVLAVETDASADAVLVHAAAASGAPFFNVTGYSPATGAQLWRVNASLPYAPPAFFSGWQSAEVHRGALITTVSSVRMRDRYDDMLRGSGFAAGGGGGAALSLLRVPAPGDPERPGMTALEYGPYASWVAAPGADWPLSVALMSDWLDPYTSDPYARTSHCRPLLQYDFTNATLSVVVVANATASRVQQDWALSFCPLPPSAACEHAGLARGWLPDA